MQSLGSKVRETLTSRKFWAAVASSAPFVLAQPPDWTSFACVWMGYAGIIGIGEAAHKLGLPPPSAEQSALRQVLAKGIEALNRSAEPRASESTEQLR